MTKPASFLGYKWTGLDTVAEGTEDHQRVRSFFDSISWDALCRYASKLHDGESCTLDPQVAMGGAHLIRIVVFDNGTRWIARLRMHLSDEDDDVVADGPTLLQIEVDCMQLVRVRTSVPVPAVYGYMTSAENDIGTPFMLMECLAGNVAMNLSIDIPPQHKSSFYADMAGFQTEICSITFPKIGSIVRLQDGTYDIGPIPGLGGPFNTATEFLKAWAEKMEFGSSMDDLEALCGDDSDEIAAQVRGFPLRLKELAVNIPIRNHGPFPLFHPDYGYNNIIVDDDYKVLGVIDWENACTVPWEIVDFPLPLGITPVPIESPKFHDKYGVPKSQKTRHTLCDQKWYTEAVRQVERSKGMPPLLSAVLGDKAGQDLAAAMRTWANDGFPGWYCKVFEAHQERWGKTHDGKIGRFGR